MRPTEEIVSIIGLGRVGQALATYLVQSKISVASVVDVDVRRAEACAQRLDIPSHGDLSSLHPGTSLALVAVPDEAVQGIADALSRSGGVRAGMVAAHTSGLLTSEVFASLRDVGVSVGSCHPCAPFAEGVFPDVEHFFFALEGDHEALMAQGGHYAELYDTYFRHQSPDYRPPPVEPILTIAGPPRTAPSPASGV